MTKPYTVVGVFQYDLGVLGTSGASFVEWVDADGPEDAVSKAAEADDARIDASVVAVFEGHISDQLFLERIKDIASG